MSISSSSDMQGENDNNNNTCELCDGVGTLACCDGCPKAYHSYCVEAFKLKPKAAVVPSAKPSETWLCPDCSEELLNQSISAMSTPVEPWSPEDYDGLCGAGNRCTFVTAVSCAGEYRSQDSETGLALLPGSCLGCRLTFHCGGRCTTAKGVSDGWFCETCITQGKANTGDDGHRFQCGVCWEANGSPLLICDGCPGVAHRSCLDGDSGALLQAGELAEAALGKPVPWLCPRCCVSDRAPVKSVRREIWGMLRAAGEPQRIAEPRRTQPRRPRGQSGPAKDGGTADGDSSGGGCSGECTAAVAAGAGAGSDAESIWMPNMQWGAGGSESPLRRRQLPDTTATTATARCSAVDTAAAADVIAAPHMRFAPQQAATGTPRKRMRVCAGGGGDALPPTAGGKQAAQIQLQPPPTAAASKRAAPLLLHDSAAGSSGVSSVSAATGAAAAAGTSPAGEQRPTPPPSPLFAPSPSPLLHLSQAQPSQQSPPPRPLRQGAKRRLFELSGGAADGTAVVAVAAEVEGKRSSVAEQLAAFQQRQGEDLARLQQAVVEEQQKQRETHTLEKQYQQQWFQQQLQAREAQQVRQSWEFQQEREGFTQRLQLREREWSERHARECGALRQQCEEERRGRAREREEHATALRAVQSAAQHARTEEERARAAREEAQQRAQAAARLAREAAYQAQEAGEQAQVEARQARAAEQEVRAAEDQQEELQQRLDAQQEETERLRADRSELRRELQAAAAAGAREHELQRQVDEQQAEAVQLRADVTELRENAAAATAAEEERKCPICFDRQRSVALVPCGHTFCEQCCARLRRRAPCPMCRERIHSRMKIFLL